MTNGRLFDVSEDLSTLRSSIAAVPPPELQGEDDLILDFETTGVEWYRGDIPVGVGYYFAKSGRTGYVAWGHRGGGNSTDEITARRWLTDIRNTRITNAAILFDEHMARNFGTSLSGRGNRLGDVQHYAALLDDSRRQFNQALLVQQFLGDEEAKVTVVDGHELQGKRMAGYHASMVAPRAMGDVRQVFKLREVMWPRLTAESLHVVRGIEEQLIPVVCEMERNAFLINRELLEQWYHESEQEHMRLLWRVSRKAGFQVKPGNAKSVERLFKELGIPITEFTETGKPSFTDEVLKSIDHPVIKDLYRAAKIEDLRSKAIVPFRRCVEADPQHLLRFALHQLRSDEGGTITGRFSSSKLQKKDDTSGVNAQQIMAVEKQQKTYGDDYIIRRLIIPPAGRLLLAADAKQIEYRIFASEANNPRIIQAYVDNPNLSFHEKVWELIKPYADVTYKQQKNLNFMKIYGGGLAKLAFMLGHISEKRLEQLQREYPRGVPRTHPDLREALKVAAIYDRELPEVGPLLKRFSDRADREGFVTTITGRRSRFPLKQRMYKAFNSFDQGSAADVMKQKLIELYEERERLGLTMRCTVHDEFVGDVADEDAAREVQTILNRQSFPQLRVPILWDVEVGPNWADVKGLEA